MRQQWNEVGHMGSEMLLLRRLNYPAHELENAYHFLPYMKCSPLMDTIDQRLSYVWLYCPTDDDIYCFPKQRNALVGSFFLSGSGLIINLHLQFSGKKQSKSVRLSIHASDSYLFKRKSGLIEIIFKKGLKPSARSSHAQIQRVSNEHSEPVTSYWNKRASQRWYIYDARRLGNQV